LEEIDNDDDDDGDGDGDGDVRWGKWADTSRYN
jgi:hypothetical protein